MKCKASLVFASCGKHKRVMLVISQKLKICDLVASRWVSYGDTARKYGIGQQTVADKDEDMREFQHKAIDPLQ